MPDLLTTLRIHANKTEMQVMEELIEKLKVKIVEILDLVDVKPEDINPDGPLVGGELEIDSIDVLELVMMIEKDYGIRIDNSEIGAKVFASLRTLAAYIHDNTAKMPG